MDIAQITADSGALSRRRPLEASVSRLWLLAGIGRRSCYRAAAGTRQSVSLSVKTRDIAW
ncbi:hypothetical protein HPB50_007303 [Hyalomma asiaticum]|uniref:Uncharacterized protein n=1 Tax=Hyalomma asiaticum TaxID=266040 RepID=A0ACB7SCU3_HYAAI|nr:hypothetical protein HPB50_007303 [Hyalomma asiaticum]